MKAPGLGEHSFEDVWRRFQERGCLLYIHGGAIRDLLLGIQPKDIDMEFSCSVPMMYNICVDNFGADSCFQRGSYFRVGKQDKESNYEPLEGVNWNSTLYGSSLSKEFTTNCLSYDLNGNDVVIDLIGTGKEDTCNRKIVIPVPENEWDAWINESEFKCRNGLSKIPRFWKLRAYPKQFDADLKTLNWIRDKVKRYWNESSGGSDKCESVTMQWIFSHFYCKSVHCDEDIIDRIQLFKLLEKDLKDTMEWYDFALMSDMGKEWFAKNVVANGMNFFTEPENEFVEWCIQWMVYWGVRVLDVFLLGWIVYRVFWPRKAESPRPSSRPLSSRPLSPRPLSPRPLSP
jgi:hypothetical protein